MGTRTPTPFDKLRSDALRADPLFKLTVGRAPVSGRDLCSQPTMSRLENAPSRIEVGRMTAALVDIFCRSFDAPPAAITLDIDDTCDPARGRQQLSPFNAFYDTRCFLPVHVYHVESSKPVAVLLRPGKTPSGVEVRGAVPRQAETLQPQTPISKTSNPGTVKEPNASFCALEISRYNRPAVNKYGYLLNFMRDYALEDFIIPLN